MERSRSSWFWRALSWPGAVWLLVLFVGPLVLMLAIALSQTDIVGRPLLGSWSLTSFGQLFQPHVLPILGRTLIYALTIVGVCLVLGYAVAYTVSRYGGRAKNLLLLLLMLPWLVDYLIRIYALLQLLSSEGVIVSVLRGTGLIDAQQQVQLLGTPFAVIVGLVYALLPFMTLPIYVAIEGVDTRLVEACRDLYGTGTDAFLRVVLPASLPGVISGATLVFLLSFGDFATARILGGPDQYLIGNFIQDQFSGVGALPLGAAASIFVLVIVMVVLGTFTWLSDRLRRRYAA
ncbi:ABC transporter permease [Leucobacter soli]|uniref:Spermidine/putrescine transport system permease protein PotB n=2 Tax=Leucobacter soli TaxID=2812850 RepID=A0A916NVK1_9MICO|nr:ABC transporter permease [Leucobacter soli]CAG7608315.1 Spermidine/putrescine transport system permease protein PotB [Leucobacter soli]